MSFLVNGNFPANFIYVNSRKGINANLNKFNFGSNNVWNKSGNTFYLFNNNTFSIEPEFTEIHLNTGVEATNSRSIKTNGLSLKSYAPVVDCSGGWFINFPVIDITNYTKMSINIVYSTMNIERSDVWVLFGVNQTKITYISGQGGYNISTELDRKTSTHLGTGLLTVDISDLLGNYYPHLVFAVGNNTYDPMEEEVIISEIYFSS